MRRGKCRWMRWLSCATELTSLLLIMLTLSVSAMSADRELLRIAISERYAASVDAATLKDPRCASLAAEKEVCAGLYVGNDYQVLDWLENAQVDGAIVSPFTLALLLGSTQQDFDKNFTVWRKPPIPIPAPKTYQLSIGRVKAGRIVPITRTQYEAFLLKLLTSDSADGSIYIDSHLSLAVPLLFDHAAAWLRAHDRTVSHQVGAFWERFVQGLSFTVHSGPRRALPDGALTVVSDARCAAEAMCLNDLPLQDVLVLRRLAMDSVGPKEAIDAPLAAVFERWIAMAQTSSSETPLSWAAADEFWRTNYRVEPLGSHLHRPFHFKIDELWRILSHGSGSADDAGIALVLTGGGVKAAYQTKLIDHLYGNGYLYNTVGVHRQPVQPGEHTLPVKYVIGTSGGALLGVFVAAVEGSPRVNFSDLLWRKYDGPNGTPGSAIASSNVFPFIDLMRWLSFVACVVVFALVCWLLLAWWQLRGRTPLSIESGVSDEHPRFLFFSFTWILLLSVSPLIIRYLNGEVAAEHIPEIEGIFYFLYALTAIFSDNSLVRVATSSNRTPSRPLVPIALIAVGTVLVAVPLAFTFYSGALQRLIAPVPFWGARITTAALWACIGLLLVFIGVHRWFDAGNPAYRRLSRKDIGSAFALIASVCAVSYVGLAVLIMARQATWLEMTGRFWRPLLIVVVIVSAGALYIGYGKHAPVALRDRIQPLLNYLLSLHPARNALFRHRYARIVGFFVLAWGWWNLILAPGLYGNEQARQYFQEVYQRAALSLGGMVRPGADAAHLDLSTFFVAPATSLEWNRERYVLFQPKASYEQDRSRRHGYLGYRNWLTVTNDPRWTVIQSAQDQDAVLLKIVFASGSPFPIFPAHRLQLPGELPEWLVDGGYAHNIPLEAAKYVGAQRVLVISSSPWGDSAEAANVPRFRLRGTLARNLARLVPYLYGRSQIEDTLSAQELLVASLSPSASPDDWPFLMDFRADVIERMFAEAETDLSRRIGRIENWGRPR